MTDFFSLTSCHYNKRNEMQLYLSITFIIKKTFIYKIHMVKIKLKYSKKGLKGMFQLSVLVKSNLGVEMGYVRWEEGILLYSHIYFKYSLDHFFKAPSIHLVL